MASVDSGIFSFQSGNDYTIEITNCLFNKTRSLANGGVISADSILNDVSISYLMIVNSTFYDFLDTDSIDTDCKCNCFEDYFRQGYLFYIF